MSVDYKEVIDMLERLMYSNMSVSKDLRAAYRKVVRPVKKDVQNEFKSMFPNDPRQSYKGVRIITLRKALGVVVGLLNQRKAGKPSTYKKPRGGRSGIIRNRPKSDRTKRVEGYQGGDRAWIMRILNQGTVNGPRSAYVGDEGRGIGRKANRGTITAKKFFRKGESSMKNAEKAFAEELKKIIEKTSKES